MARMLARKLWRWRLLEADAMQRYQDYFDYHRGRRDGRRGQTKTSESLVYSMGFELGRRDAGGPAVR